MAEHNDKRKGSGPSIRSGSSGGGSSHRGFAAMDDEKQRAIAREGGRSVPDEKRSFSQNRELAADAGRKGGRSVPGEKRSFSQDRELASVAGRKGGESRGASSGGGRSPNPDEH